MDFINGLLAQINIDEIMTKVTDYLATIDFAAILDKIVGFIMGLVG